MRMLQEVGEVSIATTQEGDETQTKDAGIVEKRSRKSNWTDAVENCDQRVDYSAFDPNIFSSKFYLTQDFLLILLL